MNFIKRNFNVSILSIFLMGASFAAVSASPEQRLKALGITLPKPTPPNPGANYVKAVRTGNLIYLAGHLPQKEDGTFIVGKLGKDISVEQANAAAKLAGINMIATLKNEIGDLSKITRIIHLNGMVNCTDSFLDFPKVINGTSDVLVSVFGDQIGKHARVAVGQASLPFGVPVEVELIVEVKADKN